MKRIFMLVCSVMLMLCVPMTSMAAEWKQDSVGWWYQNDDGSYPTASWQQINNIWYHFNNSGYMDTGWILDGDFWYYLNNSGAMQTGWFFDGNAWYYMNPSGSMRTIPLIENGLTYYFHVDKGFCFNPSGTQSDLVALTEDEYYVVLYNWVQILDSMVEESDFWDNWIESGDYEAVKDMANEYYGIIIELYDYVPPAGYEESYVKFKTANKYAAGILHSYYCTADGLANHTMTQDEAYAEYSNRLVLFDELIKSHQLGVDLLP